MIVLVSLMNVVFVMAVVLQMVHVIVMATQRIVQVTVVVQLL